ncbi:hypothetical protein BCR44DRAFT_1222007 [Catenaria anguillulae PL171]|uniref:Uncharacterized protein n=1 Tax=Catenaria anguillulae PL171 TaxID=765915 RepID=A0A1Y2I2A8_9FUNG|nr:hypothetical protein BCR44DRAFT_1222007 [Catenaria anguillulae PL171]
MLLLSVLSLLLVVICLFVRTAWFFFCLPFVFGYCFSPFDMSNISLFFNYMECLAVYFKCIFSVQSLAPATTLLPLSASFPCRSLLHLRLSLLHQGFCHLMSLHHVVLDLFLHGPRHKCSSLLSVVCQRFNVELRFMTARHRPGPSARRGPEMTDTSCAFPWVPSDMPYWPRSAW